MQSERGQSLMWMSLSSISDSIYLACQTQFFQTLFSCIKPISVLVSLAIFYPRVFVFLLPRWKWAEHLCCPPLFKCCSLPPLAMLLFYLPLTTGSAEPFSLPALGNHTLSQFSVVRHPPWQQMCAQLWTAMAELVCQISHLILLCLVIPLPSPHTHTHTLLLWALLL